MNFFEKNADEKYSTINQDKTSEGEKFFLVGVIVTILAIAFGLWHGGYLEQLLS